MSSEFQSAIARLPGAALRVARAQARQLARQLFRQAAVDAPPRPPRLRLSVLIYLRWLAIAAQFVGLMTARFVIGLDFPLAACLIAVAASAVVNVVAAGVDDETQALDADETTLQLGFDVVQLSALLALTGGTSNPFIVLLLAPVTVGAANLPLRHTAILVGLALVASAPLATRPIPLPWYAGETLQLPPLYLAGGWLALAAGLLVTAGFVWRASEEANRMETALSATEAVLGRERRLAALGGLAAAAAHELGTPLATIQITAKEMVRSLPKDDPTAEDAALVLEQAQRCREILASLTRHPETAEEGMPLVTFLEEVVGPMRHLGPRVVTSILAGDDSDEPLVQRQAEALHALRTFVENAVDFADSEVRVTAAYDAGSLMVSVRDDGEGFPAEVLPKLGQPYFTTRPSGEGSRTGHAGMGLGFFIAKTLLERTGADVAYGNLKKGAVIVVRWSREGIEAVPG